MKKITNNICIYQDVSYMNNNTFILINNNDCIIVDPSWNTNEVLKYVNENNLDLKGIILTHLHYDHVGDTYKIVDKYNSIPIYVSSNSKNELKDGNEQLFTKLIHNNKEFNTSFVDEKSKIKGFNNLEFILTPGHSESSMCIYFDNSILTGDLIFKDGIGRTDFQYSNQEDMKKSLIKLNKFILENKKNNSINILPGHGDIFKV